MIEIVKAKIPQIALVTLKCFAFLYTIEDLLAAFLKEFPVILIGMVLNLYNSFGRMGILIYWVVVTFAY